MHLLIFNLKTDADDSVLGFTTDWINALASKCRKVSVITMMAGRVAVADNVSVYSVGKEKGYSEPRRLVEFYRILWRMLRAEKVDACFAHMMPLFSVLGWPLLRASKIPIVLWYAHSHISLLLRVATALVDRVVASSSSGFRIATPKFRSIGQGIDVERFSPLTSAERQNGEKLVLLTLGRISPVKRLDTVLEALSLLQPNERSQLEMRFVGDALGASGEQYKKYLRYRVSELGLQDVVRFLPAIPFHSVQQVYQDADIFINSSDTDSIDKTVLEAMSCGLPVVTSNAAFIDVLGAQLAENWCVGKGDSAVLAKRIQQMTSMSKSDRLALGEALREIVRRDHSLPALAGRLMQQIETCRGKS